MTVRDIDRGYARLVERFQRLGRGARGITTTVGVHAEEGAEGHPTSGVPVVDVAALAEFGTSSQPPRSYLRSVVDERQATLERDLLRASEKIARGEADLVTAYGAVGLELRDLMIERMAATEALDDDTIEQKGTATPLLQTETLRAAMRVRVAGREVS